MSGAGAGRPAPLLTDDNRFFWEAARQGKLVAQECAGCRQLRHPPRPMCPTCHSLDWTSRELAGTGTIYSFSILHHPRSPSFAYPVIAVLVDLDEGLRLLSNLVEVEPAGVAIGMPVRLTFERTSDDMAVPVFAPRERST